MNTDETPAAPVNEDNQFSDPDEKEIEQKMIKTILNMPE